MPVTIDANNFSAAMHHPVTLGIIAGLTLGKPLGIFSFTLLSSKLLNAPLMGGVTWYQIFGASLLGGIGFTMSIFISGLSFTDPQYISFAKIGIIIGSGIAAVAGLLVLFLSTRNYE